MKWNFFILWSFKIKDISITKCIDLLWKQNKKKTTRVGSKKKVSNKGSIRNRGFLLVSTQRKEKKKRLNLKDSKKGKEMKTKIERRQEEEEEEEEEEKEKDKREPVPKSERTQ